MILLVGTKVEVIKPAFKGQDKKFSRIGQIGTIAHCSIPGMACVHFDDMEPGVGMFFNRSEVQIIDE